MHQDLVVGIDSSTTATKAIAWSRSGAAVAEGRAAIPLSNPRPGHFEQDPKAWWEAACEALRGVLRNIDAKAVKALAISNQRETFGVFDADGRALRPAILWLDERAKDEVKRFGEAFGRERVHRITGKPPDVTPCLYSFLWLQRHEPELWGQFDKIAEVHAYLTFRLTGEWATSLASADPMGILDMTAEGWSKELLEVLGLVPDQLPRLCVPGDVMGTLSEAAAAATGLPSGLPVVAGGGDGQCAGTGTNTLGPGFAYLNLGTAVVSGSYGQAYAFDPAFRTLRAVAERGYIFETCLRTGTFLVDWTLRELFRIDPRMEPGVFETLEAEAGAVPIGSRGLVLVPYWSGCMTPYWDTDARGIVAGFSSSHGRAELYRSLLEGIALEQAMVTAEVAAVTGPIERYLAMGGGAASDLWCQIIADASGRPVQRLATVEASALGAAVAAAKGAGWFSSIGDAAAAMSGEAIATFAPDERRHLRYRNLLDVYRDLWPAVTAWNRRLAAFAEAGDD